MTHNQPEDEMAETMTLDEAARWFAKADAERIKAERAIEDAASALAAAERHRDEVWPAFNAARMALMRAAAPGLDE